MVKIKLVLISVFLFGMFEAIGQESMMPNVSYPFLEKLIDSAKARYPRMRKMNHKIDIARYDVQLAKMGWFDGLTLSYLYNPSTNTTNTGTTPTTLVGYQTGIFVNIGQILEKAPAVRKAKTSLAIAHDEMDEYNLNIEQIVKERYFTYVTKLEVLNLRTKNAQDAETDMKQTRRRYEKGEETFDNYSKMLVITSVANQNKVESEGIVLIAKANLEEIINGKLEDIK